MGARSTDPVTTTKRQATTKTFQIGNYFSIAFFEHRQQIREQGKRRERIAQHR